MITDEMVLAVFRKYLPEDVYLVQVDHDEYINEARHHPFIGQQIKMGIYDDATFGDEFLSVARSYSKDRMVEVDVHLILRHMEGVDTLLAAAYCAYIALHEYHHIENHHEPASTPMEQMNREAECERWLTLNHPNINVLNQEAERTSNTISAVYQRLASLVARP